MRVLALEAYYGGSHRAFLDPWIEGSRHHWTLMTLPPFKWKWRMRHGAVTFAERVAKRVAAGEMWDVVFCSDMLDLATWRGLISPAIHPLPVVAYFHENQLTYPVQVEKERDIHFALTNMTTALAAHEVWFNSAFHRDEWLAAIPRMLKRMPDYQPYDAVEQIRSRSWIYPQGIGDMAKRGSRQPGPLRILWAARWEFDKGPEDFFAALEGLRRAGVAFRVSVLGESFRRVPAVFALARERFAEEIDRWGYQPDREGYLAALSEADVIVSTARHEFFGVGVAEAVAAGCYPLLPKRLAYPELLSAIDPTLRPDCFYDGCVDGLVAGLKTLAARLAADDLWRGDPKRGVDAVAEFHWPRLVPRLDDGLVRCAGSLC